MRAWKNGVLASSLVAIGAFTPVHSAHAQDVTLRASVFCNSAVDMVNYLRAAEAGMASQAPISGDTGKPSCEAAAVACYEHEAVSAIQEGNKRFRVVHITIVGLFHNGSLSSIEPRDGYMFIFEPGVEV